MILSCILLRKMDIVLVSGFGSAIGLGMRICALAKDAKTETDTMPIGTTTRAKDRNIKNPPTSPGGKFHTKTPVFSFQCIGRLNSGSLVRLWDKKSRKRETAGANSLLRRRVDEDLKRRQLTCMDCPGPRTENT